MIGVYFGIGVLILATIGSILGALKEKRAWNNGYCYCGGVWKLFDRDSQGGRGYNCQSCDKHIWISWPVDRIKSCKKK